MRKNRKGLFGSLLNIFGYGIVLLLLLMSTYGIAESYGGADAMLNETVTNETFRNNFIWHHVAFDMITPLYPVELGPFSFNIALDDGGFLFIMLITFCLSMLLYLSLRVVYNIHWPWLIVIFLVMLCIVGFVWQNYWLMVYFETGYAMGMTQEEILQTLAGTQEIVRNNIILGLSIFSMFFLMYRGKGLFHT